MKAGLMIPALASQGGAPTVVEFGEGKGLGFREELRRIPHPVIAV